MRANMSTLLAVIMVVASVAAVAVTVIMVVASVAAKAAVVFELVLSVALETLSLAIAFIEIGCG